MSEKNLKASSKDPASNNGELKTTDINLQLDNVVNVPIAIMKRVNSLKNVQVKLLEAESKFFEELHLLECKYATLYEPLYEKRKQIINGEYEPTEEESKWTLDDDLDLTAESGDKNKGDDETGKNPSNDKNETNVVKDDVVDLTKDMKAKADIGSAIPIKGVPDFWLQTFKSVELISDMIQEYDEPVLKHLYDVKVKLHEIKPYGYTLEFYFSDNEYFTNKLLTKSYELRTEIDPKDPFSYEGPDLYKCKGCTIDWKKGKNVTLRLIKKKQKHKGHGTIRVITKEIKQDSFFNYFDTPESIADDSKTQASSGTEDGKSKVKNEQHENDEDEELKDDSLLAADFEIGHFFKERIIPKAVLYFTGEIADDDYDEYDDQDDEDDLEGNFDEDDDDDDDDDDDNNKHHRSHRRHEDSKTDEDDGKKHGNKSGHKSNKGGSSKQHSDPNNKNNPPECKQN